ncbi:MAG: hypothetical protein LQ347_004503 [Umbilicaria vellea]|nr:MAG: hypothetical protein LQ347_004503 [Umbilicaria vellea]
MPWKDIKTSSNFSINALICIKRNFNSVWGLNLYQIDVPTLIDTVNYMDTVYTQYLGFRQLFLAIDILMKGLALYWVARVRPQSHMKKHKLANDCDV